MYILNAVHLLPHEWSNPNDGNDKRNKTGGSISTWWGSPSWSSGFGGIWASWRGKWSWHLWRRMFTREISLTSSTRIRQAQMTRLAQPKKNTYEGRDKLKPWKLLLLKIKGCHVNAQRISVLPGNSPYLSPPLLLRPRFGPWTSIHTLADNHHKCSRRATASRCMSYRSNRIYIDDSLGEHIVLHLFRHVRHGLPVTTAFLPPVGEILIPPHLDRSDSRSTTNPSRIVCIFCPSSVRHSQQVNQVQF